MTATATADPKVLYRIALPIELADRFENLATSTGQTPEEVLGAFLERVAPWSGDKSPIHLNDAQAAEIRTHLGARAGTPEKLVEMIGRLCHWKVGGYRIPLSPALQEQIYEYARASGRSVEDAAPELILTAIRQKFQV